MSKPLKQATTVSEQIELLTQRGMIVDNDLAVQWLANVSYYRLSAYWYPARLVNLDGTRSDRLADGTTFDDVVALYEADRKLRAVVHDGMERIEIAIRTRVGELLCADDPLSYSDPARFRSNFDHAAWMDFAANRIARAGRRNTAIEHYRSKYGAQYPFWVLAEVLDFADLSRLFEGLPARDQRRIAEGLEIVVNLEALSRNQQQKAKGQSPFVRWLEQLTIIRNTCAHHGRLWNTSFAPAPTAALRTQDDFTRLPPGQSERIFGALIVMAHLLRVVSPGTTWPEKVADLLNEAFLPNPLVSPASMGIPTGWDGTL